MSRKYNELKTLCERVMLENEDLIRRVNQGGFNPVATATNNYKKLLQAKDLALCSSRYIWDLPTSKLTSQQLEALFYQWGSLCLFEDDGGNIQFARYVTVGDLNKYGYLDEIQPIDFAGRVYGTRRAVITEKGADVTSDVCVIINDYTTVTPMVDEVGRAQLNACTTIHDEALVYNQLRTNIALSVKKAVALCDNEEQAKQVEQEALALLDPRRVIIPLTKSKTATGSALSDVLEIVNFQNTFDTQNYCQTIDFYDKTRRSFNGIPAPDTFEKKERKITAEAEDASVHTDLMLADGLSQRQSAIDLFKLYCKNPENLKISVKINPSLEQHFEEAGEQIGGDEFYE